jgi:hypothetical protein
MRNNYVVATAQYLSFLFVVLFSGNSLAQSKTAQQPAKGLPVTAKPSEAQVVSFKDIFKISKDGSVVKRHQDAIKRRSISMFQSATQIFNAPEIEFDIENPSDLSSKGTLTSFLSETINLGVDSKQLKNSLVLQAQAQSIEILMFYQKKNLAIAEMYIDLLFHKRASVLTNKILILVEPFTRALDSASAKGSANALALIKWQILKHHMFNTYKVSTKSYSAVANSLEIATTVRFPKDPLVARLEAVPETNMIFDPQNYFDVKVKRLLQDSVASQAAGISGKWELTAGLGYQQDFEKKENTLLMKFSLPIGTSFANRYKTRALLAEGSLLQEQEQLALETAKITYLRLTNDFHDLKTKLDSMLQTTNKIELLFQATVNGYQNGLTDIAPVIETMEELHSSKMDYIATQKEFEKTLVGIYIFRGELL